MTNQQHPITLSSETMNEWAMDFYELGSWRDIAIKAAQWGADQELEACVNYIDNNMSGNKAREFRAIRRPKPPSPKEEALRVLENLIETRRIVDPEYQVLRHALEALPND